MLPSRLPQRLKRAKLNITANSLAERPKHASRIGRCLALWPEVEHQLALTLAQLLGTHLTGAASVYASFPCASMRDDMLNRSAKTVLNHNDMVMFKAVIALVKSAERDKDRLASSLFGHTDDDPSVILLISPADHVPFAMKTITDTGNENLLFRLKNPPALVDAVYCYTVENLDRVLATIEQAQAATHQLNRYLSFSRRYRSQDGQTKGDRVATQKEMLGLNALAENIRQHTLEIKDRSLQNDLV